MWRRWTGCARALSDFAVRPGAPCPPSACWRRTSPGREAAPDPHGVAWSGPPRGRPPPAVDCDALRHRWRAAPWSAGVHAGRLVVVPLRADGAGERTARVLV